MRASWPALREFVEDGVHPRRCQTEIVEQFPPFRSRERSLQVGSPLGRHVLAAEFTKRLNQKAADPSGGFHVARSRAPQLDRRAADDDSATGTIGEKHHLRRHLLLALGLGTFSICIQRKYGNSKICHCQKYRLDVRFLVWPFFTHSGSSSTPPSAGCLNTR